jgi:hypothetical protein
LICLAAAISVNSARCAPVFAGAKPFFEDNCTDCHDADRKSGRLDLTTLEYHPEDAANFSLWVKIHDRVQNGEMPPKKKARPDPAQMKSFLREMDAMLKASEKGLMAGEGRATERRLNRYEYEDTLRDVLSLPWLQVKDRLPQDGEAYRFNKSGEALDVSHVQMSRYLSVADYALRQAMSADFQRPAEHTNRYYARDEFGLRNFMPRENGTLPDRLSFPLLDGHAQPDVRAGRAPVSSPDTRDREAIGKVASIFSDAGGYSWSQFYAPAGGQYRLRFAGYSIWVGGGGIGRWFYEGQGQAKAPVYYLPLWHRPNLDEVWPGRRSEPMGVYASSSGVKRPVGDFDFAPEPTTNDLLVTLLPGEVIQTDGSRLFRTRVNGSDEQYVNPLATPDGMPGYAIQWMDVDGPLPDTNATAGYHLLFGDLPMQRVTNSPGVKLDAVATGVARGRSLGGPPGGGAGGAGGRGGSGSGTNGASGGEAARGGGRGAGRFGGGGPAPSIVVEVVSQNPDADAARLLRNFMNSAYRRPVDDADVQLFLGLFKDQCAKGFGFASSLITAYTAVLCSPNFLFIQEQPGKLDDYALATRLSLFLWNSEPDPQLRALAASGKLHRPAVLMAETERLLNDPKFDRFVDAFTDYWLDLRKIDDTSPSSTLYNDYGLDDALEQAALNETRLFFADLVRENLPARNVASSDFTYLNERLAELYGVPGIKGTAMRKVTLPPDCPRGGFMTQASILKVTANGTTTSPVIRGHWITERILGIDTPPPPPGTPTIQPDIRGAVTIRQQLEKHRADPTCAMCHSKMDPAGFALENFDVMGGWRDRYRAAVAEGIAPEPGHGMDGQPFGFHYALPVEASGQLPDGREFADIKGLKQLLLQDQKSIARNLVRQLSIYATGSPVRYSDRDQIEKILSHAAASQYGVRDLIKQIVQSDLFLNK